MPYIEKENKKYYETNLRNLIEDLKRSGFTAGHLNYVFSQIAGAAFNEKSCYQTINDVVGALDGAKVEFQRRIVASYENDKIVSNGDISEYQSYNQKKLEKVLSQLELNETIQTKKLNVRARVAQSKRQKKK